MSVPVFAAPPGWPTFPAGMVPPASWVPPAQLPPPPPGWVFYRGADGAPVATPPGAWNPLPFAAPMPTAPAMAAVPQPAQPAQPAQHAPQPPLPSAPPARPRRRIGLWVALAAFLVVVLAIGGVLVYTASQVPPVISATQAGRLAEQTTFGSRPVSWRPSQVNLGTPPDLPGCKEWGSIINTKMTASFVAVDEPALQVLVFDTQTSAETLVAQWMICDFAGGSAKSKLDDTGRTNDVLWLANTEWGYFAYSNVVVITPLDEDDLNASIMATKTLVNALR